MRLRYKHKQWLWGALGFAFILGFMQVGIAGQIVNWFGTLRGTVGGNS